MTIPPRAAIAPPVWPVPAPLVPVATNTVNANPDAYYGQGVTITAAVEQILSKSAFSVDQRRAGMLPEIEQAFSALLDARQGIAQASVTSAAELTAKERAEMDAALAKLTGKKVQAQFKTDPALIGGAVVRIGSTIYDGSVRAQLDRLRARMISE